MTQNNWSDWYAAWGWFVWFGLLFLLFASLGNWGYSRRARRNLSNQSYDKSLHKVNEELLDQETRSSALAILDERFANGSISHEEYESVKAAILERRDHELFTDSKRKSA